MEVITLIKLIKFIKKHTPCWIFDFVNKLSNSRYLSQVEFHLVDHCNLNCAHCDHFTPLAPENFIKIEDIVNDFKKLRKVFDKIGKIYILGGEPLLHPNVLDIFEPLRNLYPESELIVITNGILLNKQDESFWNALKTFNVSLSMTHYPINVDYKKYIEKCQNMGIKSYYFNLNRDKMQKMDLNINGCRNKQLSFNKCSRKKCHFLKDGKLYVCTPVPNVKFLNNHFNINFEVTDKDFIDLDKVKSAAKINNIFSEPIEFCKYCNDKELSFDKFRISKKEISEWLIDD